MYLVVPYRIQPLYLLEQDPRMLARVAQAGKVLRLPTNHAPLEAAICSWEKHRHVRRWSGDCVSYEGSSALIVHAR